MEKVSIVFGVDAIRYYEHNNCINEEIKSINLKTYSFESESEKKAFLLGLDDAVGWNDYIELPQETKPDLT